MGHERPGKWATAPEAEHGHGDERFRLAVAEGDAGEEAEPVFTVLTRALERP